jgi:hypothetical protein
MFGPPVNGGSAKIGTRLRLIRGASAQFETPAKKRYYTGS